MGGGGVRSHELKLHIPSSTIWIFVWWYTIISQHSIWGHAR